MPILFSATAYRISHLHHHRHERSVEDMDEWENYTRRPWLLRFLLGIWLLVGAWSYPLHTGFHGFRLADRQTRLDIVVEYGLLVASFAAAWVWLPTKLMLEIWVFPAVVTAIVTQVRGVTEHLCTPGDEPIRATRTVISNRVVSAMMANLNYHLEHHMFSSVPWYRLREVHALLREDYRAAGACIESSYLRFLWRLFKTLLRPVPTPVPVPDLAPRSYYVHYLPVVPGDALALP
jgi:fatty acid desaturase